MMRDSDVIEIVDCLHRADIRVWLDGGWGVDALVGEQTREHGDLDLVIAIADALPAQRALERLGFTTAQCEMQTRFVVRDRHGRTVDFHTVAFDAEGGGTQILPDGRRWRYPPAGFAGSGKVAGTDVACLTAEVQVLCHLGYEPDATDWHDVRLLAERFGLELPEPYRPRAR
jgi:lincosamide nucleotidyltransferase A/C/D/E